MKEIRKGNEVKLRRGTAQQHRNGRQFGGYPTSFLLLEFWSEPAQLGQMRLNTGCSSRSRMLCGRAHVYQLVNFRWCRGSSYFFPYPFTNLFYSYRPVVRPVGRVAWMVARFATRRICSVVCRETATFVASVSSRSGNLATHKLHEKHVPPSDNCDRIPETQPSLSPLSFI